MYCFGTAGREGGIGDCVYRFDPRGWLLAAATNYSVVLEGFRYEIGMAIWSQVWEESIRELFGGQ
jgi:hypothetical protein